MNNIYDHILEFKGQWREYQKRILKNSEQYMEDHKIHVVAAPGSGKTTLGIELIRRQGAPCLILSPSITIRQQWLERIKEGFLQDGCDPETILSDDLKHMKAITAVTYQALYSAMKLFEGELKEDGDMEEEAEETAEKVDFRGFHLFDAVREAGIRTICLDEAHHLRSEWWKALESFMKEEKDMTVIALTATPPYDSTPGQWKRYIDLCGPIDEEIFTPELVREGSLCPHEDYIYFNWPAEKELEEIKKYGEQTRQTRMKILNDSHFSEMIATHKGLKDPEGYAERFLDDPEYFSSLLIFCQAQHIPFPDYLKKLIGTKGKLPELDDHWLEILLQGFLYKDTESYMVSEQERQELLRILKDGGCICRKKVSLTRQEEMRKILAKSQGKMESIGKITEAEYRSLGSQMRLLILCDYIKKDKLPMIGNPGEIPSEIGAVPVFEYLRRKQIPGIRLGCLSGSVVILPMDAKDTAERLLEERECSGTLLPLKDTGYGRMQVKGRRTHVVAAVTELFHRGQINALVGTKSLLGEGWDAPCINSLILATYVGSFMLSNQMRGRAIRMDREQPEKTGNIWHLACVFPEKEGQTKNVDLSGDYETLVRRFGTFLGISWKEPVIESGIRRLDIPEFDTKNEMEEVNRMMLKRAADRDDLKMRWQSALKEIHGDMEVTQVEAIPKEEADPTGYLFINALGKTILSTILAVLMVTGRILLERGAAGASVWTKVLTIGIFGAILLMRRYGIRLLRLSTPQRRMAQISQAVAEAMIEIGEIEDGSHCQAETESASGLLIGVWLKGGTMRERTAFAACMQELWGVIDNPRYLLVKERKIGRSSEYYAVPEMFGKQKEKAVVFEKHIRRIMGRYHLVYTRTPEGRQILLKARTRSFVNKNQRCLFGKKVAKGKYE